MRYVNKTDSLHHLVARYHLLYKWFYIYIICCKIYSKKISFNEKFVEQDITAIPSLLFSSTKGFIIGCLAAKAIKDKQVEETPKCIILQVEKLLK